MEKTIVKVEGMSCEHCVNAVTNAIKSLDGVANVVVDLKNGSAAVDYDEGRATLGQIKAAIEEEGYEAELIC